MIKKKIRMRKVLFFYCGYEKGDIFLMANLTTFIFIFQVIYACIFVCDITYSLCFYELLFKIKTLC